MTYATGGVLPARPEGSSEPIPELLKRDCSYVLPASVVRELGSGTLERLNRALVDHSAS